MTRTSMSAPYLLDLHDPTAFPDVAEALLEPDGLLAIGGDLSVKRLLTAYRRGIFPWYSDGQPILWWSPDPRAVLFPDELKISRSLKKTIKKQKYTVQTDGAFADVIAACAEPRKNAQGTWITQEMAQAYIRLHEDGYAHSVEAWCDGQLVGGLYGVSLGQVFFGESMFTRQTDASKVVFAFLVTQLRQQGYGLIDCQVFSTHLATLGARLIARDDFVQLLNQFCDVPVKNNKWTLDVTANDVISAYE